MAVCHPHPRKSRRGTSLWHALVRAVFCMALLALLCACEPRVDTPVTAPTSQRHPDAAQGFPLHMRDALGSATLEALPQRVVTLGLGADDIAVSLGVVPVGTGRADWGGDADHYWPWVREAIERTGQPLPAVIAMQPELDIEAIVALRPDVVLAPFSGMSPQAYVQLSAMVPVVAYPDRPYLTPVNQQMDLIARALGRSAQADALKTRVRNALQASAVRHPEWQGKRFAYVRADPASGNFTVYVAGDPRVDTLRGMGLELAPVIADWQASPGKFAHYLGFEHASALSEVDVVISWFYNADERDRVARMPLFAAIPAVQRGAYVALTDSALVMASSSGTPLAVDWMLERLAVPLSMAARRSQP